MPTARIVKGRVSLPGALPSFFYPTSGCQYHLHCPCASKWRSVKGPKHGNPAEGYTVAYSLYS